MATDNFMLLLQQQVVVPVNAADNLFYYSRANGKFINT
jgi:hypothetical protein